MLRRSNDPERGASVVEYGAVILIGAGITTAVLTSGIGDRVATMIENALCQLSGSDECGDPPSAAGEPTPTESSPFEWEGTEEHPDTMGAEQEPSDTIISPVEEFKDVQLGPLEEDATEANKQEREEILLEAQENDEAIIAATYAPEIAGGDRLERYEENNPPIVENHQYIVERIDGDTGDAHLRNPHDMSAVKLSSEEFYDFFPMVHTNPAGG